MEKEFIGYSEALALKKLGFDEPCVAIFGRNNELSVDDGFYKQENYHKDTVLAPTYSQGFRWFREKYNLHSRVFFDGLKELEETDEERYNFDIIEKWILGKDYFDYSYGFKHLYSSRGVYMTHEEAELECLKKLIEIVKQK